MIINNTYTNNPKTSLNFAINQLIDAIRMIYQKNSFYSTIENIIGKNNGVDIPEKIGEWVLFENSINDNLITDISDVSFTNSYTKSKVELEQITPIFCDNLMLFSLYPESLCMVNGRRVRLQNAEVSTLNTKIRNRLSNAGFKGIATHGVKIKIPYFLIIDDKITTATKQDVNNILNSRKDILDCYKTRYINNPDDRIVVVPIKIELSDLDINIVINQLKTFLDSVFAENIFLLDFDFTADFAGTMNKQELINHLINKHNFNFQSDKNFFKFSHKKSFTILDNDYKVGKDCLSWIGSYNDMKIRCKLYNKFVCQITSGGTTKDIGNHIYNFLQCPDIRLGASFKHTLVKERGITRLEATYYSLGVLPTNNDLNILRDYILSYFENEGLFYYVPLSQQWYNLVSIIKNNCILYNATYRIFHIGFWVNSITRKITGIRYKVKKHYTEKQVENLKKSIISNFSFVGLPCFFVIINEDLKNKNILKFVCKTYLKVRGYTIITRSGFINTYKSTNELIDIQERGLIYTEHIKFEIFRHRQDVIPIPIFKDGIDYIELLDDKVILYNTTKKLRTLRLNEKELYDEINKYRLIKLKERENKIQFYNQYYLLYKELLTKKEQEQQRHEEIVHKFSTNPTSLDVLYDKRGKKPFYVNVLYIKEADKQCRYLCYDDNNEILFYANKLIIDFINLNINKLPSFELKGKTYYENKIDKKVSHLISFMVIGKTYNKKLKKYNVNIDKCTIHSQLTPLYIKQIKQTKINEENKINKVENLKKDILQFNKLSNVVNPLIKFSKAYKLEILPTQTEYTVIGLENRKFRSDDRWLILFKEIPDKVYRSNFYFDNCIKANPNLLSRQFNMKTHNIGYDKNNHPAMIVSLI
jgi:hypothetical protein